MSQFFDIASASSSPAVSAGDSLTTDAAVQGNRKFPAVYIGAAVAAALLTYYLVKRK